MRTVPAAALLAAAVLLAGCSSGGTSSQPTADPGPALSTTVAPTTTAAPTTTVSAAAALPPVPTAQGAGTCPYLTSADVAAFNGEKIYGVRLDPSQNPPACFFDKSDGGQVLSVWVYTAPDAATATAAVDRAAPVATTDPASQPAGWTGGSSGSTSGAVYAVAKGPVAVIVTTNQAQSVKARRVVEQVITTLKL